MPPDPPKRIDTHVHVGVLGDDPTFKHYGALSPYIRSQLVYRIMLLYARIPFDQASDIAFRDAILDAIATSTMDHVVCLALDPVYDDSGARREDLSNMWVDNDYITRELMPRASGKILLGASVHPYDPAFETRVAACVEEGAVLLKWLPSAQQINLADARVERALHVLATARPGGKALPVLIHVGPEHAIPTTDPRTLSYDYLSWGFWDRIGNGLKKKSERMVKPDVKRVRANLRGGLESGAHVILAHCGLPYFAPRFLRFLEHSDFPVVRDLLRETAASPNRLGKCYADVSACVSPFRESYFGDIAKLPEDFVLAASDYPVPVFELSADLEENMRDFEAMMNGHLERIAVPQDNLLAINWHELEHAFGANHPMFRNAGPLLL